MRVLRVLLPLLGLLIAGAYALSWKVSQPAFDETVDPGAPLTLAPLDKALTFARVRENGEMRLLLVTSVDGDSVTAVNLSEHMNLSHALAIRAYRGFGSQAIRAAAAGAAQTYSLDQLELPFDAPERNLGLGLNYSEHAKESGLDKPPFYFPKHAAPTRWNADLAKADSTLLDYEVEMGLVLLEPVTGQNASTARYGLVLANEATDRFALVRNYRGDAPMGTTGFADGKSRDGFAPIGPWLVIPDDPDAFAASVPLQLAVNGRLRQRESTGAMRWNARKAIVEAFTHRELAYEYAGNSGPLFEGALPEGTIIFSGTPAGVIFKPLNLWNPWVYLRPGDVVELRGGPLGVIRNRITE